MRLFAVFCEGVAVFLFFLAFLFAIAVGKTVLGLSALMFGMFFTYQIYKDTTK